MGSFTINSAGLVPAAYDPLIVNFQLSGPVSNIKQVVRITDGEAAGSNELNFNYPPGITIIQPAIWNRVGFNPDQFRINTVGVLLGAGGAGTAFLTEEDGTTVPSLPVTISTAFGSPSQQYQLGIENFTNGSGQTTVNMNIDFIDTGAGVTINRDVQINFLNAVATIQDDGTTDDGCTGVKTVTVQVPAGTTKHITGVVSGANVTINGSGNFTETITANKTYNLTIIGDDATTPITSTADLIVRDNNASGPVEDQDNYTRQHNSNIC